MTAAGKTGPRQAARTRLRAPTVVIALAVLVAVVLGAMLSGAGDLGWQRVLGEIVAEVTGGQSPLSEREAAILWQLRAPMVLLAGLVGAALAVSGATFQGVFRNPLADPYLLGAAAGAGMAATFVVVVVPGATPWLPVAAFAGALGGVGLSWLLGRAGAHSSTSTLLLAGVAVGSFLTALQTFVQQLNTETIRQVYTWMLGGLNLTGWREVLVVLPYIAAASFVLCLSARLVDVLTLGEAEAASLGVRPARLRLVLIAAASLATAAAVSVSGLIGFVGIVVPHLVRLLAGASYRVVIPLSLIGGAVFLILADQIARGLGPAELPLGVVTAFAGAPFFAAVLRSERARAR